MLSYLKRRNAVTLASVIFRKICNWKHAITPTSTMSSFCMGLELDSGLVCLQTEDLGRQEKRQNVAIPESLRKHDEVLLVSTYMDSVLERNRSAIHENELCPRVPRQKTIIDGLECNRDLFETLTSSVPEIVVDGSFVVENGRGGHKTFERFLVVSSRGPQQVVAKCISVFLKFGVKLFYRLQPAESSFVLQTTRTTDQVVTDECILMLSCNPIYHPSFDDKLTVAVFHDFQRTMDVLHKSDGMQEVKSLLQISPDYIKEPSTKPDALRARMRHPFIVVEGLDGTGKSTLVQSLGKHLNAALLDTPPDCIGQLRRKFDCRCELVRRAYYSAGNYMVSQDVARNCEHNTVVMDRFWHSTAAYAIAYDSGSGGPSSLPAAGHWVYDWPRDLLKPDAVIFLTVSESVRNKRLEGRDEHKTAEEQQLSASFSFRQRLMEAYRRMSNPPCVEISAEGTKEEVLQATLDKLKLIGVL